MATKPKGLGRGLEALLGGNTAPPPPAPAAPEIPRTLPVAQLQAGKYQPRTRMGDEALAHLAESIKAQGVIQPILVRKLAASKYEIIAGERRFRASKLAGLTEVPVVIRDVPDKSALAMALIENIQREDLNPLEEAQGIERLVKEFGLTHEEAAQAVGRSRSAASNLLRLLNLPKPIQEFVYGGQLDMGHARALLPLDPVRQLALANQIIAKNLSVRQTEKLVQQGSLGGNAAGASSKRPTQADLPLSRDVARFTEELSERFGTTVDIKQRGRGGSKGGKLIIDYSSNEHLDDLLARFK